MDLELAARILGGDPNVVAAWAFGSVASGRALADSDVDIAVLFRTHATLDAMCDLRGRLQRALGIEDVDLTVLNGAGVMLQFQAICGRLLWVRDRERLATFQSLVAREFEDEFAFQQPRKVA